MNMILSFAVGTTRPEMIDFREHPFLETFFAAEEPWMTGLAKQARRAGLIAFNEGPEMGAFFLLLQEEYGLDTVVETGTHQGFSTFFFANWFKEVHTVEIFGPSFWKARFAFESMPHVHCHYGSSEQVLQTLLPTLQEKPLIFYLDAHWETYWPLLDELEVISRTHKDNCVIVIDDVRVPGRSDLGFDGYGSDICELAYFRKGLEQVFTDFSSHYLLPKQSSSRGKFVAIPSSLRRVAE